MRARGGSLLFRKRGALAGVALAAVAAGCTTGDTRSYRDLRVADNEVPRVGEAVVFSEACPVKDNVTEIRTPKAAVSLVEVPLIGLAVDVAANAIDDALKAAAEGLNGSFLVLGSIDPSAVPEEPNEVCVIIARGLIGDVGEVPSGGGKMKKEHLKPLGLADYPAFYLEMKGSIAEVARQARDENGNRANGTESVMTLTPVYLRYAQSAATNRGSGKKAVTLAIALARKQPSGKDSLEEGAAAIFRFNFGRLEVGHEYESAKLKHLVASQVVDQNAGPSIAALVTESEDPSIALKALTTAFTSNKADLSKAFKDAFAGESGGGS